MFEYLLGAGMIAAMSYRHYLITRGDPGLIHGTHKNPRKFARYCDKFKDKPISLFIYGKRFEKIYKDYNFSCIEELKKCAIKNDWRILGFNIVGKKYKFTFCEDDNDIIIHFKEVEVCQSLSTLE